MVQHSCAGLLEALLSLSKIFKCPFQKPPWGQQTKHNTWQWHCNARLVNVNRDAVSLPLYIPSLAHWNSLGSVFHGVFWARLIFGEGIHICHLSASQGQASNGNQGLHPTGLSLGQRALSAVPDYPQSSSSHIFLGTGCCGSLEQLKKLHHPPLTKDLLLHLALPVQASEPEHCISLERRSGHRRKILLSKARQSWGTIHLTFIHFSLVLLFLLPKNTSVVEPDLSLKQIHRVPELHQGLIWLPRA